MSWEAEIGEVLEGRAAEMEERPYLSKEKAGTDSDSCPLTLPCSPWHECAPREENEIKFKQDFNLKMKVKEAESFSSKLGRSFYFSFLLIKIK